MRYKKSRGIPRHKMPQIESKNVPLFLDFLHHKKIRNNKEKVVVSSLLPTQSEYNDGKVKAMVNIPDDVLSKPVIVSSDNYILDGHHRYSAMLLKDPNRMFEVYRVHTKIDDLLRLAKEFPLTFYKGINESTGIIRFSTFCSL